MRSLASTLLGAIFCLGAAPAIAQGGTAPFIGAHGATVPSTYTGSFDKTDWHLDLWPDQAFHLLRTPQGGGAPVADAGRWHANGRSLLLDLDGAALALEVRNADRLRPEGVSEDARADLVGEGRLDPADLSVPVDGMFTYYADAAIILHCATGRTYPVMQEGAYIQLERAYLETQSGPAEPLFVTIDGTIDMRAQMEGADRLSMIVDDFHATWPGEDCNRAAAAPGLTGAVWRIDSIGGQAVDWTSREPFLLLDDRTARFNASVGCNTMLGGFSAADGLSFGPMSSTMMACPDDVAAHETALAAALAATSGHEIGGRTLRLF